MHAILPIFLMFVLTGCTGPLAVLGQIYGGADAITSITTGKGATDTLISSGVNKDCRIHRVFRNEPMCKEIPLSELGETMLHMNCDTYSFTDAGHPYCKEMDDELNGD